MFIALTGLHCSGKSYFSSNLPSSYNFSVYNKNKILDKLYDEYADKFIFLDSNSWYNYIYELNPYSATAMIINEIYLSDNIILDAVHSNLEWEIIKQIYPNAKLVEFVTPKEIRENRWISKYTIEEKDNKRINYWHNEKADSKCLISEVDWAFNGSASLEFNYKCFEEMMCFYGNLKYEDSEYTKEEIKQKILELGG